MKDSLTKKQLDYVRRTKEARKAASKLREDRGLPEIDQSDVAKAIGVDRVTYTGYETRRTMPQKYQDAFCQFLGISEKWLIRGDGPMFTEHRGPKKDLIDLIAGMTDDEIERLQAIARLVRAPL